MDRCYTGLETISAPCERSGVEARSAREVLTIQEIVVLPGEEDEFLRRFGRLDVLAIAAEAAGGELLEAALAQDGNRFVVVTSWSSEDGIERWIASEARTHVREELDGLYAQPPTVTRYEGRTRFVSEARET